MQDLVSDLTDLSQIESGAVTLQLEEVPVQGLLAGVVKDLEGVAHAQGVEVALEAARSSRVTGDRRRLAQVFRNLVDNAVKFSPAGARVDVVAEADAGGRGGPRASSSTSIDRGIGIPASEQAKVFQRFYRVDPSRSKTTPGTGLGLAIVKHLLILHGGSIRVESEPRQGEPLHASPFPPRRPPTLRPEGGLMKEHFTDLLESLRRQLIGMGAEVESQIRVAIEALVEADAAKARRVMRARPGHRRPRGEERGGRRSTSSPRSSRWRATCGSSSPALRINADLERIGDHAVNIAEAAERMSHVRPFKPWIDIPYMAEVARGMLRDSLDAFVRRDSGLALEVCRRDDILDEKNKSLIRELLTYMAENPALIVGSIEIMVDLEEPGAGRRPLDEHRRGDDLHRRGADHQARLQDPAPGSTAA